MIQDARFQFSTNQAITAASAFSTNFADVGSILSDRGNGEPLYVQFQCTEDFVEDTPTPQLQLLVVLASTNSGGTPIVIGGSQVYGIDDTNVFGIPVNTDQLTAGKLFPVAINPLSDSQRKTMKSAADLGIPLRYLGVSYFLAGGTFSAGKFSAILTSASASRVLISQFADAAPN